MGYSSRGSKESDMSEQLSTAHTAILYLIVSKQSQSNIKAKQDPVGLSQKRYPSHHVLSQPFVCRETLVNE